MKKYFLTITAALLAIFLFADGEIIVMDRAYYDQCASGFYLTVGNMRISIEEFCSSFDNSVAYWRANLQRINGNLTLIDSDLAVAQGKISDHAAANNDLDSNLSGSMSGITQARNRISNIQSSISDTMSNMQDVQYSISSEGNDLLAQLNSVSNSFPTVITSTNFVLDVTVIVSNNFDFATNALEQAQHSYTNFLNYYRGIEDEMLDQFRATVTNLLDVSNLPYYIDTSYWTTRKPRSDYIYFNYDFYQAYSLANTSMFPSSASQQNWVGCYWTIPDTTSYNEFLNFTLQGVHDSLQYIGKNSMMIHNLLWQANTNKVFSYALSQQQTNAMARFLSAPDTYDEQVAKAAQSRNLFQRIEMWLSSIAKNTYKEDKPQTDDDTESSRQQMHQALSNDVQHALSSSFDHFNEIGDKSTNVFTAAKTKFNDNITAIYNLFTSGGSSRRSGNDQSAAQRFQKLEFMEMHWAGELLQSKTHKSNDIPNYLHVADIEHGNGSNSAWSISMRLVDIIHKVFGILWCLIGFGLGIYEIVMLTKFFIVIWWRLLKYLPNVARYALGT